MQSHIAWGQFLIALGIVMVVFGMAGIIFVKRPCWSPRRRSALHD